MQSKVRWPIFRAILTPYLNVRVTVSQQTHLAHIPKIIYISLSKLPSKSQPKPPLSLNNNINMSSIQIDNITITNPKALVSEPIRFQITFTALQPLPHPILWRIIYVGSAFTEDYDQVLEEF